MKKKLVSLLTAAVLVMSMGTIAFATESPNAGQVSDVVKNPTQNATIDKVETKSPESYVKDTTVTGTVKKSDGSSEEAEIIVSPVAKDTVDTTAKEIDTQLKDVENIADLINAPELKEAAKDSNKKIVPELKTVVNVKAKNIEITKENPVTLTITADVKAGDAILVLHWNGTAWETIAPDAVQDGKVVVTLTSLSPLAIVKLNVEDIKTPGGDNGNGGNSGNAGNNSQNPSSGTTTGTTGTTTGATTGATTGTTGSTTGTTAGSTTGAATATTTSAKVNGSTKTSPKTGMETSVFPMLAVAFAAAGLACAKKAKNN